MLGSLSPVKPMTDARQRGPGPRRGVRLLLPLVLVASSLTGLTPVQAESPSPTIVGSGDPRSEGEGAGLVGSPLLVAFAVIAVGAAASVITLVIVRLRGED